MQLIPKKIHEQLNKTYQTSPLLHLGPKDRVVIFSDLHMGSGGRNDDFEGNGVFFRKLLESHYLPGAWNLVLNGDVEELLRHSMVGIVNRWKKLYGTFHKFQEQGRLWKIEGNHDPRSKQVDVDFQILPGLRLKVGGGEVFICHGHQGGSLSSPGVNTFIGGLLRFFANPLGIGNSSPAYHSQARYKIEERLYRYASSKSLAMVVGHTHRPLFETSSKTSNYEFRLEALCRKYIKAPDREKPTIQRRIEYMKTGYLDHMRSSTRDLPSGLYHKEILVPSLFNSGCAIGKRGITALEISSQKFRLVQWSDPLIHLPSKIQMESLSTREVMPGLNRTIIRKESTQRIMARIKLLGGENN